MKGCPLASSQHLTWGKRQAPTLLHWCLVKSYLRLLIPIDSRAHMAVTQQWADAALQLLWRSLLRGQCCSRAAVGCRWSWHIPSP